MSAGTTSTTAVGATSTTEAPSTSTTVAPTTTTAPETTTTTGAGSTSTSLVTTTTGAADTTTTTASVEQCDNCTDDDHDGLVDRADPDCCAVEPLGFALKRVRIKPLGQESVLKLRGVLVAAGQDASATHDLVVQLGGDAVSSPYCAVIPAAGFTARGRRHGFKDPAGAAAGAGGLQRVTMKVTPAGTKLKLRGARAPLAAVAPGTLRVALALGADGEMRCGSAEGTVRRRGKLLRFP